MDVEFAEKLLQYPLFQDVPVAYQQEHSVQIEVPLLQYKLNDFKLVLIVAGQCSYDTVARAGRILASLIDTDTLVVASSDFTHYGPNYDYVPFDRDVPRRLHAWLSEASDAVARLDEAAFQRHCADTGDTICGSVPIRILMRALQESGRKVRGRVLATATSGEIMGRYDNSVSYAAIGFFGDPGANPAPVAAGNLRKEDSAVKEKRSGEWSPGLTEAEKKTLFAIARDTLRWCVEGRKGKFRYDGYTLTPAMQTNTATFVTLKIAGQLRGCIGSLAPVEPLYLSVHGNAVNAALRDPRFLPVGPDELPRIEVDVSILSPIRDIGSPAEFKIGHHGIILEKGMYRAVYLPEVAVEQGWGMEETLSSLSLKAGLGPDAWREGARFQVFESVVLSE